MTLLQYLRGVACMKGTKEGCSTGHCGACTVIINGKAERSCVFRMDRLDGAKVLTIEGLHGENGALHPIQRSFLDVGAVQCGFCTPGMVMATKALLDRNPDPTDEEIYEGLKNNYCRCTGYVKIIEAVHLAAARLRGEDPTFDQIRTMENIEIVTYTAPGDPTAADLTGRHIGKSKTDYDGTQKVCGTLPYTCDRADEKTRRAHDIGCCAFGRHRLPETVCGKKQHPGQHRQGAAQTRLHDFRPIGAQFYFETVRSKMKPL